MRANSAVVVLVLTCGLAVLPTSGQAPTYTTPQAPVTNGPVVTAPIIDLNTVSASPVGASNATPRLEAGAENSTINHVPAMEGTTGTQAVIANPPNATGPTGGVALNAPQPTAGFNPGVGMVSGGPDGLTPLPPGQSLGDVARQYRARKQAQNERTVTNSDLEKLPGNGTVGGITGATNAAATSEAPQQPAPEPTVATPPVKLQSPRAMLPKTTELAQSTLPQASNTGNVYPSGTASDPATTSLPRSASPLPLIALFGGALGAAGLFVRHRRK